MVDGDAVTFIVQGFGVIVGQDRNRIRIRMTNGQETEVDYQYVSPALPTLVPQIREQVEQYTSSACSWSSKSASQPQPQPRKPKPT